MGTASDNPFNPNLSMLCDYYELTMGNAYFANGMHNQTTYFDLGSCPTGAATLLRRGWSRRWSIFPT